MGLASRIAKASAAVGGRLKADSRNQEQKYDYISADKILSVCGQALAEQEVTVIPAIAAEVVEVVERGNGKFRYDAAVTFHMIVADDEKEITAMWVGRGSDYTVPDKALYKAITSGHKYFLMKLLNIGEGNEDGEHETADDAPAQRPPARQQPQRQAPPVTPVTTNGKRNPATDMPERMAPSELPHSRLEPHESLGNGHKPTEAPADDVALISKVQLKALHAAGNDLYGAEWDWKRMSLVESITKGEFSSASDLTAAQADKLIQGMRDRIAKRNHDAEHSDEQPADNPFTETPEPVAA